AFFDSLVAQQDRHSANWRWDQVNAQLRLIDHGFCFALPGDYENAFKLIDERWGRGQQALATNEVQRLTELVDSLDLLGMGGLLEPSRVDALRKRAQRM